MYRNLHRPTKHTGVADESTLALPDGFATESNSSCPITAHCSPLWDMSGPGPIPGPSLMVEQTLNCSYNDHVNITPGFTINFCYIL